MPGNLGRNLNMWFTKIKAPASSQSSILPQGGDQGRPLSIPTPSSVLIKNFNSLYDLAFDCTTHSKSFTRSTTTSDDRLSSSGSDSEDTSTPDLATVFASQRFFFSSPGRSNSIIDSSSLSSLASTSTSSPGNPPAPNSIIDGSIAIPTYSPDPFLDFRRSMQEMVEAHDPIDVRANWDYLDELLTCYLSLNPKSTHKFIVGAFADLLVSLMASSTENGCRKSKFSEGAGKLSRGWM